MKLDSFFNPRAVAVIGASRSPKKIGHQILANLISGNYQGAIYPINPAARNILGRKAYSSIAIIKPKIDLAILALPASLVMEELDKCGQRGVKNVIVIAAGFGEISVSGREIEKEMGRLAKKYKMNILGPNCLGLISSKHKLNASFAEYKGFADQGRKNNIALVSQSGAIASSILDFADSHNLGLSHFVSLGNEADLDESDIFDYLLTDKETELVAVYLEQIKEGGRFISSLTRLAKVKPVIILKAGQTAAGEAAAKSHTGSLVGSYAATTVAVERAGAIMAHNLSELFDLLVFSHRLRKIGPDLSIISNAGGPLVLSADAALAQGLVLAPLSKVVKKGLAKKMPGLVQPKNPLDILGDAAAERYAAAMDVFLSNKKTENLLVILTPQTVTEVKQTALNIVAAAKKYPSALITAVFIGGRDVAFGMEILRSHFIPVFDYPETAIVALAKLAHYYQAVSQVKPYKIAREKQFVFRGELMDFMASIKLLVEYNISVATTKKIGEVKNNFKYPLVAKIVGPSLLHKSEYHAVFPNVESAVELKRLLKHPLLGKMNNYLVMQERIDSGTEMILGFKRDEVFGPLLVLGYGGVYTEVFKDTVLFLPDLDIKTAKNLIARLKSYAILAGARTGKKLAIDELAKTMVKLAKLATEHPEIKELDINPLFVSEKQVKAADIRIII